MSRIVAVHTPPWRRGIARVHLLRSQRRFSRTLCGSSSSPRDRTLIPCWRRCRVENARGEWCETCLRVAGVTP